MVQIHQWSDKFLFADYLNSIWHVMSFLIQIACCICCIYTRLQFVVYVYLDEISYIQRETYFFEVLFCQIFQSIFTFEDLGPIVLSLYDNKFSQRIL